MYRADTGAYCRILSEGRMGNKEKDSIILDVYFDYL